MKDVERWLYAEGLDEAVNAFRTAKIKGEDILDLNPNNVVTKLNVDDSIAMRVCASLLPLKSSWKRSRQIAGLKTNMKPARPTHTKLVADLHILVDGATYLPPGSSGAYIEVEVGDHRIKSGFIPAPAPIYAEAGWSAYSPYPMIESSHPHAATHAIASEPQSFRLSIDQKSKNEMIAIKEDKIKLCVVAWMPHKGELEVGKVEIPLPDIKDGVVQIRVDKPVRAELQWVAYGAPLKADDWKPVPMEEHKVAPLEGAWYTPCETPYHIPYDYY